MGRRQPGITSPSRAVVEIAQHVLDAQEPSSGSRTLDVSVKQAATAWAAKKSALTASQTVRLANGDTFVMQTTGGPVIIAADTGPVRPARKAPAPRAVQDAPGCEMWPDPGQVQTSAELVAALQEFREWAGDVPFRVMAERSGQLVSASTLHRALNGTALPPQAAVIAVIAGCGGSEEDKQRFVSAWRRIRKARSTGAAQRPAPVLRALPTARIC
jgi:hypothetical protein